MKNVYNFYKKLSLPAKASLWYMICNIFQRGIGVITTPIYTRVLSTDQYGLVSIYNSWEGIITIFATLNFTSGVFNNAMVKYEDDRDGYTSVMQTWTTILTVAIACVYFVGKDFWNGFIGLPTSLMVLMFIDIIFTAAISFWSVRNRYEYKYLNVCIFTLLSSILVPIVSVLMILSTESYKSEARVVGMVVVHVLLYGIVYFLNIKKGKKLLQKEYIEYSTKFNLPLIPHYLSQNVLNQADRIMINNMVSTAKAGIYSVAYAAGSLINIIVNSINASFVPYLYESLKKKEIYKVGRLAVKIELAIGGICFLFSLMAPELLKILATSDYYEAVWIIPPVAMSSLFVMMYSFFTNVQFYFEKNKFIMIASIITALANVVMNYTFIKLVGYIAAGYTTLACYFIYCLAQYLFMKRVCKDNNTENPYNGKVMWGIAIGFVLLSIVGELLYMNTILRYTVIATLATVLFVLFLLNKKAVMAFMRK